MVRADHLAALKAQIDRVLALGRSVSPTDWSEPSRCAGWTCSDVYAHLATDFERFGEWLDETRAGLFEIPFPPEQFAADNAARLEAFSGVAGPERVEAFDRAAGAWIERIRSLPDGQPQRHPRGLITIGTQVAFATGEVALHGWDVATALGRDWAPVEGAGWIAAVWGIDGGAEPWSALLRASGRTPDPS